MSKTPIASGLRQLSRVCMLGPALLAAAGLFVVIREAGTQRARADFVSKWGALGTGPGQFAHPPGVNADATGNVDGSDGDKHRIQKLSAVRAPPTPATRWWGYGALVLASIGAAAALIPWRRRGAAVDLRRAPAGPVVRAGNSLETAEDSKNDDAEFDIGRSRKDLRAHQWITGHHTSD